jgi:NAD(P)-dependent dehydrogenase (short-subunit alcohol dehydrogenase family)
MSRDLQLNGGHARPAGGTKGVGEAVVARLSEAGVKVLTTARSRVDDPAELYIVSDALLRGGFLDQVQQLLVIALRRPQPRPSRFPISES